MATWVIHGFNVRDGGKGSVDRLTAYLEKPVRNCDYGWTNLITLRCVNARTVNRMARLVKPGDVLIGHSNGALIAWEIAQRVQGLAGVAVINAAMRRDTLWPKGLPVLCLHNSTDWVVQLGLMWSRLVSAGGYLHPHGWGAAGRYGFTTGQPMVSNWDTAMDYWKHPVKGHSGMFQTPEDARYWGTLINAWTQAAKKDHRNA